jgi:hypothetical protein
VRPQPVPAHVKQRRIERQRRLSALGYKNYADYLGSPHWLATRARYRASELPQECICGETEVHLHHLTYERVGGEELGDLTPLCHVCHALVHELEFRGDMTLSLAGFQDVERSEAGRRLLRQAAERRRLEQADILLDAQRELLALPVATRLMRVVDAARSRHMDISRPVHILRQMAKRGCEPHQFVRRLARLEENVYGWAGWSAQQSISGGKAA